MRPPHITRDYHTQIPRQVVTATRFNEAPAYYEGLLRLCGNKGRGRQRFNEAPAYYEGLQAYNDQVDLDRSRFNEAPAYYEGLPRSALTMRVHSIASMRPPHITRDYAVLVGEPRPHLPASMRPPHITRDYLRLPVGITTGSTLQ